MGENTTERAARARINSKVMLFIPTPSRRGADDVGFRLDMSQYKNTDKCYQGGNSVRLPDIYDKGRYISDYVC